MTEGKGGSPEWAVLGLDRLRDALQGEPDDQAEDVIAAFEQFVKDPTNAPLGLLRGPASDKYPDTLLLRLPHQWVASVKLFHGGLPPLSGPIVMLRAVVRLWTRDADLPAPEPDEAP